MNQELWNLTILGMKGRKKITILIFTVLLLSFAFAVAGSSMVTANTATINKVDGFFVRCFIVTFLLN